MKHLLFALLLISITSCKPAPEKANASKAAKAVIATTPSGTAPAAATGAAATKAAIDAAKK